MKEFRTLRADEIECRISQITQKGLMLLLYKDARCDQRLLDEVVGAENWQRKHEVVDGNLYCSVGIYVERQNGGEWVWKQDVGTESFTEKEKGQASDSFKRACFNWGIGRELYTAPLVWIQAADCDIKDGQNGKKQCYDRFRVTDIAYDANRNISRLIVENMTSKKMVFAYGAGTKKASTGTKATKKAETPQPAENIAKKKVFDYVIRHNVNVAQICDFYKIETLGAMTDEMVQHYIDFITKKGGNIDA